MAGTYNYLFRNASSSLAALKANTIYDVTGVIQGTQPREMIVRSATANQATLLVASDPSVYFPHVPGTIPVTIVGPNITSVTSTYVWKAEPTSDELTQHVVGWFTIGQATKKTSFVELDFVCPSGLYRASSGNLISVNVPLLVEYQKLDAAGDPTGAIFEEVLTYTPSTKPGIPLNTPQRKTFTIDVNQGGAAVVGKWRVRARRTDNAPADPANHMTTMQWTALRTYYTMENPDGAVAYSDMTLVAVKIRATRGISSTGQQEIRVKASRLIKTLDPASVSPDDLVPTRNAMDAFYDIFTDPVVGANRPESELDIPTLQEQWTETVGTNGFNAVFDSQTTVWEALEAAVMPVRRKPVPVGGQLSIVADGPNPVRAFMFTPDNIVGETLKITYDYRDVDFDGYEVAYRSPDDFQELTAVYPTSAARPQKVVLFGCTNATTANNYAKLLWQQYLYQRQIIELETGLEGLLPQIGQRFGVGHPLPDWGDHARIVEIEAPLLFVLDRDPPASGWAWFRSEDGTGADEGPFAFTRTAEFTVQFASGPSFPLFDMSSTQEPTFLALGTSADFVSEWVFTRIEPTGEGRVVIEGSIYDENVWSGTTSLGS